MAWVDTNILVRLVTNDVPDLAAAAISKVRQSKRGELIILDAVLVELFFVLESRNQPYRLSRDKVEILFRGILKLPQFQISDMALAAFEIFTANPKLDFADCLLLAHAGRQSTQILTFDKDLLKLTKA
ncbi:MAG: PIN domain-containing protein [Candidatus Saccharimonadales bacterium]